MRTEFLYAGGLVVYLILAWVTAEVYKLGGENNSTLVFILLSLIGATGIALFYFLKEKWMARSAGGGDTQSGNTQLPAADGLPGEVDLVVRNAESRFSGSKAASLSPGGVAGMPVIFVLGEQGSTKTSIVQNSACEPDLLAGHLSGSDGSTVSTPSANLWLARQVIFAEAGGKLWSDSQAWSRLLKRLTPGQWKAAVGGGRQAPRAAILCVDVEKFLQPGAPEAMARASKAAQDRLREISQQFGISFPVYVLFTRSDRLPFFLDYVRHLSNEEAAQVMGATLPIARFEPGVFAQEQTQRLGQAFDDLFYSLGDRRLDLMPREAVADQRPPCYEFPREFRKLKGLLVPYLVEICRPTQLATTTPFLRGFYFTGARPIVIPDIAATPVARPAGPAPSFSAEATSLFSVAQRQPAAVAPPPLSGGRKVPQWVFLTRFFQEIVMADKAALGAAGPSAQASTLRRILLGTAAALALLWTLLATVSFFKNRSLENEVLEATERIKQVRLSAGSLPGQDDLKRLDGLREKLGQLTTWNREGAPWSYRWGLYTGTDLLPLVRKAYYQSFSQLLFRETQQDRIASFLRSRPSQARPDEDYNYGYDALRSYLLTTKEWNRSSEDRERDYLSSQLRTRWLEGHKDVDQDRRALAEKQFDFYAGDLRNGNPFSDREDAEAVNTARVWLGSFPLLESRYNAMLGASEKGLKAVNFNRDNPGTAAVVVNNKDVRPAFTKDGWSAMASIFKKPNISAAEPWVLPDSFRRANDTPGDMLAQIKDRYAADYVKRWRDYFNADTNVLGYASLDDASNKLKEHSGGRPAVIYLIGTASAHTNPDATAEPALAKKVKDAFQWAHNVVPPGAYIVPGKNDGYVSALTELQMAVESAAKNKNDNAALLTLDSAQKKAELVAKNLGRPLSPDTEGGLDRTILNILVKPTLLTVPKPEPPENAAGKALCAQFDLIKRKFPFDPQAKAEVSVDELDGFLKPGTGAIWQLYEASLKQSVMRLGNQFQANPSANPPVNPDFIRFFNEVARLSTAFYPGGQGPKLNYSIQLSEVELVLDQGRAKSGSMTIDGKKAELGKAPQSFVWTGAPAHSVAFEYNDQTSFRDQGVWAVFKFFVDATVTQDGGGYQMTWPVRGGVGNKTIAKAHFNVNLGGAPAVFDRRFMAGMRCMAQVVK